MLWKLYKRNNYLNVHNEYKIIKPFIKNGIRVAHNDYFANIWRNLKNNPSQFWYYAVKFYDNSLTGHSWYKWFALFHLAFITSNNFDVTGQSFNAVYLSSLIFSEDTVMHALKNIKAEVATGPDGIPTFLLKECLYFR